MELCHEKHSELPIHLRSYKGRVVCRGGQVRDESGFYAVFSEQGTSASHLAAAKFLDAISRFPDCDGENADASSAYTQVRFEDLIKDGQDIPESPKVGIDMQEQDGEHAKELAVLQGEN